MATNKSALLESYIKYLENDSQIKEEGTARIQANMKIHYLPHIFNGGWLIDDFGYSCERMKIPGIRIADIYAHLTGPKRPL